MAVIRETIERDLQEKAELDRQVSWIRKRQIASIILSILVLVFMTFNLMRLEQKIRHDNEVIQLLIENLKAINQLE